MNIRYFTAAVVVTLLCGTSASAQSAADLLQKGIHAQETVGDLDGAIAIFRQVAASPSTGKLLAAQAQYQLVLCLLQKGDRTGAAREAQALQANFPDQQDLVTKARQAMGGGETLSRAPWGEREILQMNIKRDGAFTGETLFYTIDPDLGDGGARKPNPQVAYLTWELNTKTTQRSVRLQVDRDTMQLIQDPSRSNPSLTFTDEMGDPAASSLSGPAIDLQGSVFLLRRMPLAPGYKTTLTSTPLTIGTTGPKQLDLEVTGIEAVQTAGGKYNCFKVVFGSIGQTFWFNADASRALVRFKSGNVEAENVRIWLADDLTKPVLAPFQSAGWKTIGGNGGIGRTAHVDAMPPRSNYYSVGVDITKIFTPAAEIPEALQTAARAEISVRSREFNGVVRLPGKFEVRANGIRTSLIGGQQALSIVGDRAEDGPDRLPKTYYIVFIQTENTLAKFTVGNAANTYNIAGLRWELDQILGAIRLP